MADEAHDCSEIAEVPGSYALTSSSSEGVEINNSGKQVPGSSASKSSSSEGVIINNNSGKQGDVFTHVGSVIKDVGGDVFNNLHVVGDFNYGKKKKLQPTLPRFVVLKATYNGKCLRLTENDAGLFPAGFLKFDGRESELASRRAKFELETAKCGHEFVHIRCCYNKKYLVRSGESDFTTFIVAAADKPEEDESKISCTMFKLEQVKKSGRVEFRFLHGQRGSYACFWRCWNSGHFGVQNHGGLCVGTNENDAYTVIAWESLAEKMMEAVVQLPKFVALEGSWKSNEYLSLATNNDPSFPTGFLKFEKNEVASPMTKFKMEIAKSESGLVHIRCWDNHKYLVRENTRCTFCNNNNTKICDSCCNNPYFIIAAADKPEEDEYKISSTLFKPEPYNESGELKFRFCHIHLGMRRYVCMCPAHGELYGGSNEPHKDACDVFRVLDLDGLGQQSGAELRTGLGGLSPTKSEREKVAEEEEEERKKEVVGGG